MSRQAPGITVHGVGRVTVHPDTATVTLGVDVLRPTAGAAQVAGSGAMRSVIVALRAAGVADDDLATQHISLDAQYDYSDAAPRLTGYLSSQTLLVRARVLERLGPLIDTSIDAGATRVDSVAFSLDDAASATTLARSHAFADARARAATLADAAGLHVGAATSIVESGGASGGPPVGFERMALMAKADTPVVAGTTEISVEVDVTFAVGD